ncbi:gamma-interferon-inducible lysosomal thiol reductase isoform X1 [Procambarus clarkii]|uniref:gamma-interferon-inducible lysosomal thiol reductase isoform X1 n=1 Tax=Procambarus clarkii TaxID=6728 RepID=UPI003741F1B7
MSDKCVHSCGVDMSAPGGAHPGAEAPRHSQRLLKALMCSSSSTFETKRRGMELLERTVENAAGTASRNSGEIVALNLFVRISNTRRREWPHRYCGACEPMWTMVLLCTVLALVLINDMSTYGNLHYRRRREASSVNDTSALTSSQEVTVHPFLHVEVYYEALCPDSRYFVMKQLTPAYEKLHEIMNVALIPYGKARTQEKDGKLVFDCQHGPVECKANMVHACVTNIVKDEGKQLAIVHCMIEKNDMPLKIGQKCVEKNGENWQNVEACILSDKGSSILKHMGDMTNSLKPRVSFIPTITIDRVQDDQKHILQDLHKVLCKRYKGPKPPSC